MASLRKRGRVWYYRVTDADGVKREVKGCPDRRATEEMARAAESEAARTRAGLIDPNAEARRRQAGRPLAAHIDDWHAHLIAKGGTAKHASLFVERARRLAAIVAGGGLEEIDPPRSAPKAVRDGAATRKGGLLGSARLFDLTSARAQAALAVLKDGGRSLATCNHHRSAIRAFSRWAWRDGRTADDALIGLAGYNAKEDRRHDRRTLSVDELRRLIAAAHRGDAYRRMTGPARALCYRLAVATGLRFSEIASITLASFALSGDSPSVTVAAGYTKNGEPATQPFPDDLATDLAPLVAATRPGCPVFPLPDRGADMLKSDLQSAGIPYRDAAGLVFDFHSLRCQCATLADAAGVSPRVVQRMMRHSTLELTGRYTRPRLSDLAGATNALPTLRPEDPDGEPMAATGTDGQPIGNLLAHYLPTGADGNGRELSDSDGMTGSLAEPPIEHNSLRMTDLDGLGRGLAGTVASSGGGTRTPDTRIMIPLL